MLKSFFDLSSLHSDRILNWHLRLRVPQQQYFVDNSNHGSYQIIAIGDAAHGLPIVESVGAGLAAEDATDLARWLQKLDAGDSKHVDDENFYKRPSVSRDWFEQAVRAVQRLRKCHGQPLLNRKELEDTIGFWVDGVDTESLGFEDVSSSSDTETAPQDKGKL